MCTLEPWTDSPGTMHRSCDPIFELNHEFFTVAVFEMPYPSLWGVFVGYSPLGKVLSWKNQCPKMKTPGGEAPGLPGEKPLWSADGEVEAGTQNTRLSDGVERQRSLPTLGQKSRKYGIFLRPPTPTPISKANKCLIRWIRRPDPPPASLSGFPSQDAERKSAESVLGECVLAARPASHAGVQWPASMTTRPEIFFPVTVRKKNMTPINKKNPFSLVLRKDRADSGLRSLFFNKVNVFELKLDLKCSDQ